MTNSTTGITPAPQKPYHLTTTPEKVELFKHSIETILLNMETLQGICEDLQHEYSYFSDLYEELSYQDFTTYHNMLDEVSKITGGN